MTDDREQLPEPTKLTASKQRWAREGRFLTGQPSRPEAERLPPGQHLVRDWPVLDLGRHPSIARDEWKLLILGAVQNPVVWDWATLMRQPQSRKISDIHCVTSWSRYDNAWEGVATRDLLDIVMPRGEARFVILHGHDGYTTNLPLEDFAAEDAILAHSWQDRPLSKEHGGPVRLIMPHLYFWKSAKWLQRIDFAATDEPGFWEVNGYHNRGDPWREQRYSGD
ncbi:sulfite oxidase-like oxidoreductase [Sphingomonas oleivorans]|uniref:Sulfite oxidase-like oxidoreductase n=1 Tax=Sphingomonas oleivorans TaxID=1735121 RepID=A0A2T5FWY2_9SPHN|nr:sulfite oxidase-like oxidoreductase [Sphingomonas oleivorans]PTQ10255.1 sulfite oxidase-like oxidoreductase [Sphingomonas oleivorans]